MFIVVSGPIGAGKSTVTKIYTQVTGFEPLYETVEGHPYLEKFYKEPRKWAFKTQVFFLYDRFNKHYETVRNGRMPFSPKSSIKEEKWMKMNIKRPISLILSC